MRRIVLACGILALHLAGSVWAGEVTDYRPTPGVKHPVEILVDQWGVPHIFGKDEGDVFFAQGWNAARDRLWQIDLWRRRGLGRLAEVLGPDYVAQDRAARLFLYHGSMKKEWAQHDPKERAAIERFVAGINTYIADLDHHPERMPLEFRLLKYNPALWFADDIVRIRSNGLVSNLTREVARARLACLKGLVYNDLYAHLEPEEQPRVAEGMDPCLPADVLDVYRLATRNVEFHRSNDHATAIEQEIDPVATASNNWVISAAHSKTGRPILANDPHRGYAAPSLRYIVHLSAPGLNVIGAGEPALPGISFGHNDHAAFGLTIFPVDQEDLYVYELDPADPHRYRYHGRFEPMQVATETIQVAGETPRQVKLAFTRHGPVIAVETSKNRAFAVRTVWTEPGAVPYLTAFRAMYAGTWSHFLKAVDRWAVPPLNLVYADDRGDIGWAASAFAPNRPKWDGLLPVPGDGRFEWSRIDHGNFLPRALNPAKGWFATANQYNVPAGHPEWRGLGYEWSDDNRYNRIAQVLGSKPKNGIEDSLALQTDETSLFAERMSHIFADVAGDNRGIAFLRGWNGSLAAESGQAALFEVWATRHIGKAFRDAIMPDEIAQAIPQAQSTTILLWFETPDLFGPNGRARRDELILASLDSAYDETKKLLGSDPKTWAWGSLLRSRPDHPLAAVVDPLTHETLSAGEYPIGGDFASPNQRTYRESDFIHSNGASVRFVMDVGNWDNSKAVNHPGQSGDPHSAHYRDLGPIWAKGDYFPLNFSRGAIERNIERRIVLLPKP